jgi:hypothetical protein
VPMATLWEPDRSDRFARLRAPTAFADLTITITQASLDGLRRAVANYGSGGLRRSRAVRKYTDRFIRARVAAAMAPAHQYQPPSVTAATIKPAASTTSVVASPSRHHRGNPELTL